MTVQSEDLGWHWVVGQGFMQSVRAHQFSARRASRSRESHGEILRVAGEVLVIEEDYLHLHNRKD